MRGLVQGVTRVSKMDPAKLDERTDLCLLADGAAADTLLQCLATVDAEDADADVSDGSSSSSSSSSGSTPSLTLSDSRAALLQQCGASDDLLRLLHACAGDWRVAVLKVADRLHNMRTLGAMAPVKRAKKARETERIFVPLAHYLGAHDVGRELQRLSTRYRSDGLKGHRALAARARSSILIEPLERLGDALRRIRGNGEWAGRAVFGSLPAVSLIGHSGGGSSSSRSGTSHAFKPPRIPQREVGSERRLRQLILQLDEAEPDRGLELYVSLRPLHERLTRHQAVMMREASWSPEER